ncbi:MAG: hypothetical protein KJ597_07545, partial [Nanoarchaeota archaeon]|nr:hypothetical protein [Nanoarchaeota archaeon]
MGDGPIEIRTRVYKSTNLDFSGAPTAAAGTPSNLPHVTYDPGIVNINPYYLTVPRGTGVYLELDSLEAPQEQTVRNLLSRICASELTFALGSVPTGYCYLVDPASDEAGVFFEGAPNYLPTEILRFLHETFMAEGSVITSEDLQYCAREYVRSYKDYINGDIRELNRFRGGSSIGEEERTFICNEIDYIETLAKTLGVEFDRSRALAEKGYITSALEQISAELSSRESDPIRLLIDFMGVLGDYTDEDKEEAYRFLG